jgi:hypothetical protein
MSSTQACSDELLDQASSINWVSNKKHIKKNTLNKLNDRSNVRTNFVENKMSTVQNPYDANIIFEQAKAYEQATKKMNEKILELTSYVDAMKKTNTSNNQNSVPSSPSSPSIQSPLSVSQKEIQKEIDRMLKIMPSFKGDSDDNFESWQLSVKQCLSYGRNCSEQQKLDVVRTKIGGHALQTLEHEGELNTIEAVFKSLKKTYGKDQRAIISNVKQLPTETVKLYSVRLKNNLRELGIKEDPASPSVIALDYFVSGLLPAISKRVKTLLPETYAAAEGYAFQIECENPNLISKKGDSLNACLNVGASSSYSNSNNSSRYQPYKSDRANQNNSSNKQSRPYSGVCFGCNKQGHAYWQCQSISKEKRDEIHQNFATYLTKYRLERNQNQNQSLNSLGRTTSSQ